MPPPFWVQRKLTKYGVSGKMKLRLSYGRPGRCCIWRLASPKGGGAYVEENPEDFGMRFVRNRTSRCLYHNYALTARL